jgi:hypothetical protein
MNAKADKMPTAAALARPFAGARWLDVQPRHACVPQLAATVLLHAGPPFRGAAPAPVRQAAIQAMLFENLAPDAGVAQALLASGVVRLEPAQNHGVVTPLAQVVSHSMPMAVVGDAHFRAYAPLSEGPAPALRFGSLLPECLERLRAVTGASFALRNCVRANPVAMSLLIERALSLGDECHSRTAAANQLLLEALPGLEAEPRKLIAANPGFVLPVLMAAACWALHTTQGGAIELAGGNGQEFGIRRRGTAEWEVVAATPPLGTRFPHHPYTSVLGAVGDSAVLDFCGLGGQALAFAPSLADEWKDILPAEASQRRAAIIDPATGSVDPQRVHESGLAPIVHLAMLDQSGAGGLVGRGFYIPEPALFNAAQYEAVP